MKEADPAQALLTEASDRFLLGRFVRLRDEQAFATLVRRHGPMVFAACRRMLATIQDAEDALQGTFLVLARKAHTLKDPDLLANWLYGVSYRIARKARSQAVRRGQHEREAALMAGAGNVMQTHDGDRELCDLIDEELHRLPAKYRVPLVLCYLEGKTNEQVARQMGWPLGSMSYRMERARSMLRSRLARRTHACVVSEFDVRLAKATMPLAVPDSLVATTVKRALGGSGGSGVGPGLLALAGLFLKAKAPMMCRAAIGTFALATALAAGAYASGLEPPKWLFGAESGAKVGGCRPPHGCRSCLHGKILGPRAALRAAGCEPPANP